MSRIKIEDLPDKSPQGIENVVGGAKLAAAEEDDRYANLETSYLLLRTESFTPLTPLVSNTK